MYSASRSDVRTLFISDVHLGSKYCNPKPLIELLLNVCPEHVYLVGDICDGWILRRNWLWNRDSESFVETLGKLERKGSRITYLLGNHDRCLQRWVSEWGNFWVGEKCIHTLTDGRKLLLIHGDQFDRTQIKFSSAAAFTARIHERVLGGSQMANRLLREFGLSSRPMATVLSKPIKTLAHSFSQFKTHAKNMAIKESCDGILFGHTHTPMLREEKQFVWANSGDWLEHCTAILETGSGQLELWSCDGHSWRSSSCRHSVLPSPAVVSLG